MKTIRSNQHRPLTVTDSKGIWALTAKEHVGGWEWAARRLKFFPYKSCASQVSASTGKRGAHTWVDSLTVSGKEAPVYFIPVKIPRLSRLWGPLGQALEIISLRGSTMCHTHSTSSLYASWLHGGWFPRFHHRKMFRLKDWKKLRYLTLGEWLCKLR